MIFPASLKLYCNFGTSHKCVFVSVCACVFVQVVQPVMWRGAVFAKRANLVLHTRQCTSHQVSETLAMSPTLPVAVCPSVSFLCLCFCLVDENRKTVPLFYMTPVGTLFIKKWVKFEGGDNYPECECVCVRILKITWSWNILPATVAVQRQSMGLHFTM